MPIEFRCPSCSKLLRTPDESAGKKAKCPQCGSIADVPAQFGLDPLTADQSATASPLAPIPPTSPFIGMSQPPGKPPVSSSPTDAANPCASPSLVETQAPTQFANQPMQHSAITFDQIWNLTWQLFQPNLGQFALFGLVIFGVTVGVQILNQVVSFAAQASGDNLAIAGSFAFSFVTGYAANIWITVGAANYMLRFMRRGVPQLNDVFNIGPYVLRTIGLMLLLGLFFVAILALLAIPGGILLAVRQQEAAIAAFIVGGICYMVFAIYFGIGLVVAIPLLIDQDVGVMEAIRSSLNYCKGNRMTIFLVYLATGVLGGLFVCVTCYLGMILYIPYFNLLNAVIYFGVTGQDVVRAWWTRAPS